MNRYFLILIFLVLALESGAQSSSSISPEERIKGSDLVVCGEVSDFYSFWDDNHKNIYTAYRIKVLQTIKGAGTTEPEVLIKGGIVDNIRHDVSTSVWFEKGDMGCFILKNLNPENGIVKGSQNRYILSGGRNGFFRLEDKPGDEFAADMPVSDREVSEYIERILTKYKNPEKTEKIELKSSSASHFITDISPEVSTAGTGSVLDIHGQGFGVSQGGGEIWFVSGNNPGYIFTSGAIVIKTWRDTLIQVVIPSEAATGTVRVRINDEFAVSAEVLTVRYSYSNKDITPYVLINTDQAGGYTWHLNTELNSNIAAASIVNRSIEKWVCATQIPWLTGEITGATSGMDGLCTISIEALEGGLGETGSFSEAVYTNSALTEWVIREFDIVFNENVIWSFNRQNISEGQYDFESVVLHELAHAHLLSHVNDPADLMHAGITAQSIRDISSTNIECGMYALNKGLNFTNVNYEKIILSERYLIGAAEAITGNSSVCTGQNSVTYTVPAIDGAVSYIWSLPAGATGTSTTNSIDVSYASGAVSGDITVRGANSCKTGEPSVLAVTVGDVPLPAGTITGITTVCQEQGSVSYAVPAIEGATSYVWTLPDGATGTSATNSITVNYGSDATSGDITVKGLNSCGYGASAALAITVNNKPVTPVISLAGNVLHSDAASGNQWYSQNGLISGATHQDYTVTYSGDYYVIVTLSECSSNASNSIHAVPTSIEILDSDKIFKVYPNPVSDELTIELKGNDEESTFEIISSAGQVVYRGSLIESITVQAAHFAPGLYLIKLGNGKAINIKKITKE